MATFLCNAILWILALYGLFEITKTIFWICTYTRQKADGIYVIFAVKNQEERLEGFMRTFLFRLLYGKEENIKEIILPAADSHLADRSSLLWSGYLCADSGKRG